MHLKYLKLSNFKNLDNQFDFEEGVNIIVGVNGAGKTNTLEAAFILSTGSSFNTYPEINLINFDSSKGFSKISGQVGGDLLEVIISENGDGTNKKLKYNSSDRSTADFLRMSDVIFFSPNTVDLVAGSPSVRRRDLDIFLSQLDDAYAYKLAQYRKVLRSRNKLLYKFKSNAGSLTELDYWNDKLVELGSYLLRKRLELIDNISNFITDLAENLFAVELEGMEVGYFSSLEIDEEVDEAFRESIQEDLDREIAMGSTQFGPHRDDLIFLLGGKELRIIGSRGMQRMAALIYKLALWRYINAITEEKPLLLLDDIMSELDAKHRKNIEDFIINGNLGQVIITSSSKNEFSRGFLKDSKVIEL